MQEFKKRVFGCAIIKSINSNYNADFTKQPRTLPNGVVYATDKALKYMIKFFIKQNYSDKKVMYFKRLNNENNPLNLEETYEKLFEGNFGNTKLDKLYNLLQCIDIRLFGATFAMKSRTKNKTDNVNISIHGPVQICHGVNRFPDNIIYSEQILSPFRSDKEPKKGEDEKEAQSSTLGSQFKLMEGHYVHHFSINPSNLKSHAENLKLNKKIDNESDVLLTDEDISIFKEAISKGVTYFDSSSKAGTENELLLWIELPEGSKKIIPNLTEFITINRDNEKIVIDLLKVEELLEKSKLTAECIYYDDQNLNLIFKKENSRITKVLLEEDKTKEE